MKGIIGGIVIGIFLTGCLNEGDVNKKTTGDTDQAPVDYTECVKKAIYYKLKTDETEYDSISTSYFKEIEDYTDSSTIKMQEALWEKETLFNQFWSTNSDSDSSNMHIVLENEIDSLKKELKSIEKEIVGYVFVHTFSIGKDTSSMIFIIDDRCEKWDAIPIKTIKDIEPNSFVKNIRAL